MMHAYNEKENQKESDSKILHDISILLANKVPLNSRGVERTTLDFEIKDENTLNQLIDGLLSNFSFKGTLNIVSTKFNDTHGLKVAKIIKNNTVTSLKIWNRNKPFSDRVSILIGKALSKNTQLKCLVIFLEVGELSPIYLIKFLLNPHSSLEFFSYMKITKKLIESFAQFINKESKLNLLHFYFEPLKEVNLLYEKEIPEDLKDSFADKIQNNSNITGVCIIPLEEKYSEGINVKLANDINILEKTWQFSCEIIKKEKESEIFIDKIFQEQNKVINHIVKTIDRKEGKETKNSIVSVRTYLERAIGESLNQALYDLEVQRERNPEKKELFTAKGSIRYVAQYLLNNKQ